MRTLRPRTTTAADGPAAPRSILIAPTRERPERPGLRRLRQSGRSPGALTRGSSDPDRLDADNDGIACENFSDYSDGSTDMTPVGTGTEDEDDGQGAEEETMVMPEGGVATGGGATTGIENGGLLAVGALVVTVGAGGLVLARRQGAGA